MKRVKEKRLVDLVMEDPLLNRMKEKYADVLDAKARLECAMSHRQGELCTDYQHALLKLERKNGKKK